MRRKRWALASAAILIAATCGVVALSGGGDTPAAARPSAANTANVEFGDLSAMVSAAGTLTYRARSDGSPYALINQARGVYTKLPENGDRIGCGGVLYRVDDKPVVLLCGTVPAYRDLHMDDAGKDVRQLNRNLHKLGYDVAAGVDIDPGDPDFTTETAQALEQFQRHVGVPATGELGTDEAIFLPGAVRISRVTGELGGSARPGTPVAQATSNTPEVQVDLDASQQGQVKKGDRAQITLPGNRAVKGRVDRLGKVAEAPAGAGNNIGAATIPAYISLDEPGRANGLDEAPVLVDVTTKGVKGVLSVPVTAIVGRSGGGYAVEAVRDDGHRELVAVHLGLFDTAGGRVQVEGDLREGDSVAVPSL